MRHWNAFGFSEYPRPTRFSVMKHLFETQPKKVFEPIHASSPDGDCSTNKLFLKTLIIICTRLQCRNLILKNLHPRVFGNVYFSNTLLAGFFWQFRTYFVFHQWESKPSVNVLNFQKPELCKQRLTTFKLQLTKRKITNRII